jgi:acyl-CoA thioester hydrolase
MSPTKPQAEPRSAYRVFRTITTRWMDNDAYGHVNNVIYYSWFDTAVNAHLIEQGVLDIHQGETIGLVIETQCNYFRAAGLSADGRGRDPGGQARHLQRAL